MVRPLSAGAGCGQRCVSSIPQHHFIVEASFSVPHWRNIRLLIRVDTSPSELCSLRRANKATLLAVIAACHDRTHSCSCLRSQLACHDISSQRTLRQAINKADELQTAAAIIQELLMDCIMIVSANTQPTFLNGRTLPAAVFSTVSVKTTRLSQAEVGVRMEKWGDKLL